MGHEANVTAADGISHVGGLPELATDTVSGIWSHHFAALLNPRLLPRNGPRHHFVCRVDVETRTLQIDYVLKYFRDTV